MAKMRLVCGRAESFHSACPYYENATRGLQDTAHHMHEIRAYNTTRGKGTQLQLPPSTAITYGYLFCLLSSSLSPVSYLLHIYAKILKPEVYEKFSNQSRAKNFQTTPISCKNFETSPIRKEDHFLMLISLSKNSKPVVFFIDKYPYVWYGIDKITRDNP